MFRACRVSREPWEVQISPRLPKLLTDSPLRWRTSCARYRVVGAAECFDPLPRYRRGTALPCFPLIDDGLPRGAHPGREPLLTQAQAPAHGPDADVVLGQESTGDGEETSLVFGISEQAVIFVSLPPEPVELVARLSAPEHARLESIEVGVEGRTIAHWGSVDPDGYRDYAASIPADPDRPPISSITFHFDASTTDDILVKLNRVSFQVVHSY